MRRRLQQVRSELVAHGAVCVGAVATLVYLLTMDRSASWWDCGEFIATGWILGVGHPSGAPVYQLLSHLFMLLSFGNPLWVAPLSNAFSALCAGITVGVLYATIRELGAKPFGALVGALCYLFCDTAWFSAVESEVYAPAMLFCSLDVWIVLRWRRTGNARLLPLLGLLLGLGVGVHLMTLLVVPALALIIFSRISGTSRFSRIIKTLLFSFFFFLLGLTPYAVIPIRAAANPSINEMRGSFGDYLKREQYEKAPLYPRMWRERDAAHYRSWTFSDQGFAANAAYYVTYQLGYMYGRYLMYNFIGRENLRWHCVVLFVLPILLALWGLWQHRKRSRRDWWVVMLLFLFGGVILNLYLNHPCYEPRSRDYAYVLSFYAVAIWIGLGADEINEKVKSKKKKNHHGNSLSSSLFSLSTLLLLAPITLAVGNWSDHDRSRCHSVHDIALNHLNSCDPDAILITLGDNDTFPLWYLQQVEGQRTDVDVYNLGLTGWSRVLQLVNNSDGRPVYFTQFFYDSFGHLYPDRLRCEGFCWRLLPEADEDLTPLVHDGIGWHITPHEYVDPVSQRFLTTWRSLHGSLPFDR
ncbi:MAG: DUF2723 domain-containing protein [Bacteroidales bacterium]|nr:DUF2723 domain-containing protein [Bacteroidales bacterium]